MPRMNPAICAATRAGDVPMQGQLAAAPKPESATGCQMAVSNMLFVDDGAFVFGSHREVHKLLSIPKDTFAKFGPLMHVSAASTNGKLTQSKTEALHFQAWPSTLTMDQLVPETVHFGKKWLLPCPLHQ